MEINWYRYTAVTTIAFVSVVYIMKFTGVIEGIFPDDPAVWGQFGDFMGGTLNPILSFISIMLLIKSISLQNQANRDLRGEIEENKINEKLRSFNSLFFGMIQTQKSLFDNFFIDNPFFNVSSSPIILPDEYIIEDNCKNIFQSKVKKIFGVEAILFIEDEIWKRKKIENQSDEDIRDFLSELDEKDKIFGMIRSFYVAIRMVSEKLGNAEGFDCVERKKFILTLINFTDFSHLRLIVIGIQFMNYPIGQYLKSNDEFIAVLGDVGLKLDMY